MAKKKHPGGRPTIKSKKVLEDLQKALESGLTIAGACGYAGISEDVFYKWQRKDSKFVKMVQGAKVRGQALIEFAILKDIKEDPKRALEVARRRYPEWQDRQTTKHEGGEDFGKNATVVDVKEILEGVDISDEDKEKIRDAVNKRQFPGRGFSREEG